MPNPDKTPGQKLVEEFLDERSFIKISKRSEVELWARVDRLIAELTPKRVLDLRDTVRINVDGKAAIPTWELKYYLSTQLPDVEVKT